MAKMHKCADCKFCNEEKLMCFPQSEDCEKSYQLDKDDLVVPSRCDFYKPKEN